MKKSFVFWSSVKPLQSVCVLFVKLLLWNVVTLKLFGHKVNARIPVFSTFSTLSHQKWPHFGTIQNVNWSLDELPFLETFWNLVFRDLLPEKTLETRFTFIFGQNFQKSFQFQKRCRRKSRFLIHIPAHAAVTQPQARHRGPSCRNRRLVSPPQWLQNAQTSSFFYQRSTPRAF